MAKLNIAKSLTIRILVAANIFVAVGMIAVGYAGYLEPEHFPLIAITGLAFPVFLVLNIVYLLFWGMFYRRMLVISGVALLLSIDLIADYSPITIPSTHPEGSIKVLSYNTLAYNTSEAGTPNGILLYILYSGADIVCVQEHNQYVVANDETWNEVNKVYTYSDTLCVGTGGSCIAVFSKYPIRKRQHIDFESKGNLAGVFDIDINGKLVHLINCHLETVGLSIEDKEGFQKIVNGESHAHEAKHETKLLASKIKDSTVKRAAQARAIAKYINDHKGESIILCGDFNDHPLSYTHRMIASGLTDCYRKAANLPGFSFNYGSMYVRIDNIMCSDDWTPYECQVDKSIELSDHYPITCYLR